MGRSPALLGFLVALAAFAVPGTLAACQVRQVAAGASFSLALRDDGTVWVMGKGLLRGPGAPSDRFAPPSPVAGLPEISSVAAGRDHALAVDVDGGVWAWGENQAGELGPRAGSVFSRSPVDVPNLPPVDQVAAGTYISLALARDGTVWSWGWNSSGQLGIGGGPEFSPNPARVVGLAGVVAIAAGDLHALAVLQDGTVRAWGAGAGGQLGNGQTVDQSAPVEVAVLENVTAVAAGVEHSLAATSAGEVWSWGRNSAGELATVPVGVTSDLPLKIDGIAGVQDVAAGWLVSLALRSDGTLAVWGTNEWGLLGAETPGGTNVPLDLAGVTGVGAVSLGYRHALALLDDATVRSWGDNGQGGLGVEPRLFVDTPAPVALSSVGALSAGTDASYAVLDDGSGQAWGRNDLGQLGVDPFRWKVPAPKPVVDATGLTAMTGGNGHTLMLLADGTVLTRGDNTRGQLGDGTLNHSPAAVTAALPGRARQVSAGPDFSLALMEDGTVQGWGSNWHSQLGSPDPNIALEPMAVGGLIGIEAVSAGADFAAALDGDGSLWLWGNLPFDELAPITPPQPLPGVDDAVALSAGWYRVHLVRAGGEVWSYDGYVLARVDGLPPMASVATGADFALGLTTDGNVWAWGDAGLESATPNGDPVLVDLPGPALAVAAGRRHGLVLLQDGSVLSWGDNQQGQAGIGEGLVSWDVQDPGFGGPVAELPATLRLARRGAGVQVSWRRLYNAVTYNLYRSTDPTFGVGTLLGTTPAPQLEDPAPPDGLVLYQTRAVDCSGQEGP